MRVALRQGEVQGRARFQVAMFGYRRSRARQVAVDVLRETIGVAGQNLHAFRWNVMPLFGQTLADGLHRLALA